MNNKHSTKNITNESVKMRQWTKSSGEAHYTTCLKNMIYIYDTHIQIQINIGNK